MTTRRKLTVPMVAKQMGVAQKKVLDWIRAGELRAINLARRIDNRPRYAIDVADLEAFERSRLVIPEAKPVRRIRRSQVGPSGIDHFAHIPG